MIKLIFPGDWLPVLILHPDGDHGDHLHPHCPPPQEAEAGQPGRQEARGDQQPGGGHGGRHRLPGGRDGQHRDRRNDACEKVTLSELKQDKICLAPSVVYKVC